MPGLPITDDRQQLAERHAQRLRGRRIVLAVVAVMLSGWLAGAAQSPSSGLIERILLLAIAVMIPLHVMFWQLGFGVLDRATRWPRPLALPIALLALATSPMVLYPLGAIAVLVSLFAGGGAATPALAVSGL